MDWMNQIGDLLRNYSGDGAAQRNNVDNDFDNVAQNAPPDLLSDGLATAFRSDQTPPFGQMVGNMFGNASGQQRAGILNQLIAALGPAVLSRILSGRGGGGGILGNILAGGKTQVTPEEAEQVSPDEVTQIAEEAEKENPSIVDQISDFYSRNPTLVKALGTAALALIMSRISKRAGLGI